MPLPRETMNPAMCGLGESVRLFAPEGDLGMMGAPITDVVPLRTRDPGSTPRTTVGEPGPAVMIVREGRRFGDTPGEGHS